MSLSAKQLFRRRSKTEGRTFLKYSDLPMGTRILETRVLMVRETPRLNSPAAFDIAPEVMCDGRPVTVTADSVTINLTNLQLIGEQVGDDLAKLAGSVITWSFSMKSNPNAKGPDDAEVMGFDFVSAKLPPPIPAGNGMEPAAAPEKPARGRSR